MQRKLLFTIDKQHMVQFKYPSLELIFGIMSRESVRMKSNVVIKKELRSNYA